MSEPPRLGRPPRRSEETTQRLRSDIASGRFAGAETLPGERQLADLLQVSRTTLRRALADLVAEGVLIQRQGLGTVVAKAAAPPQRPRTAAMPSYQTNGLNIEVTSVHELWRGFADAGPDEALVLFALPGQQVFRATRVLLCDDRPVALESEVAPRRFVAGSGLPSGSIIDGLTLDGAVPTDAIMRLRAARLTLEEASALAMDRSTPTVSLEKALYLGDGRCCALIRLLFPASLLDVVALGRLA